MGSLARAYESLAQLRQLLDQGGSPNLEFDSQRGWHLLHRAAVDNRTDVLLLLLDHRAELEATANDGRTAVDLALEHRCLDALRLLLERGASPDGGTGEPRKPESTLHTASRILDDDRFLRLLLEHGASGGIPDVHQDLPVHRACLEENEPAVRLLLRHRPRDRDRRGARGLTPLHIAANLGNARLFLAVLRFGPRLDLLDDQDRTVVDVLLAKQDTAILEAVGHFMVNPVLLTGGSSIKQLLATPQGQHFLRLLRTIDNEFQHNFGHECNDEDEGEDGHAMDDHYSDPLMSHLRFSEQFDINDFIDIVSRACAGGLGAAIVKAGMVGKLADNILKHIFVPQNEALLQEVKKLGMLWSAVVAHLENNILMVYDHGLGDRRKDGIKGLVCRNCLNDAGLVSRHKLHKLVANLTHFWQLQWVGDSEAEAKTGGRDERLFAMRDPVQSLAVWSVLTGRLRLAPYFLRQEDFDLIPQALLLANILRRLGRRRDIEDIYTEKAIKMAATCEGIAIQALRRIKDVDVTPNNCLTMELIMLPLETFGGYSILELAARGESSSFVIIDIVQESLSRLWYRDFFFARKDSRQTLLMELAIACGFLPPLQPLTAMLMPHFRVNEPDFVKLQLKAAADDAPCEGKSQDAGCKPQLLDTRLDGTEVALLPQRSRVRQEASPSALVELLRFYQIPSVKFRIHVAAHISFVILLSYVVMFQMAKGAITVEEKVCYLTLLGFLVEEVNELVTSAREETVKDYFLDGWNIIDITAITCGFTAFALRIECKTAIQNYWALVLLTTTCLVYWVRLLYVSVVLESLGPKLKMMSLMVKKDFLPFLYILFVLMFGFGVTFHALQYPQGKSIQSAGSDSPESSETAVDIVLGMFKNTFYAIVGEYGLDNFQNSCNMSDISGANANDGDDPNCVHPIGAVLVPTVFMVLYIVVMQILLLNVIVAMFSKTIDAINSESRAMWQFEKFDLIEEFNTRSAMPPPLNLLAEARNLAVFAWRRLRRRDGPEPRPQGVGESPRSSKVYMLGLYYQALAFRNCRSTFNGVVLDEEDLDEGNKIIFQQINSINERLEKFERLEETVKELEALAKELKALSLRGPSNISAKRGSVQLMPYIEEAQGK